ncbi:tectonic-3 isoform X1 [Carettochelys insculpta]|uniref:tectonic-3 isoform X1 n=1 Tax=Carettochelys insculpta TaxID=44489 RepID=UPI003EC1017C
MGPMWALLPLLLLLQLWCGVGTLSPTAEGSTGPLSPTAEIGLGPVIYPGSVGTTSEATSGPGPPSAEGGTSAEPKPSATPGVQGDISTPEVCLPTCICNLHPGSCDLNCCCDPDCNLGCDLGDTRAAFSFCIPGSTRAESQVCVKKSLIFRNNTPLHTEIITDPNGYESLFCMHLFDSKLNYFQKPQIVKKTDFSEFLAHYGGPSFIPASQDQPSSFAFYRAGDPIQTYFAASSVLSTLRQPMGMGASGLCFDGNPARFLVSKSTSCTRSFTNLSSSCTTDPALDAASYYRDFTILKVPVNRTDVQLMQVKISPVTQPGAPQMDGNTCYNVVDEVIYEIEFNGTYGIQNISVQLKVSSVSGNSLQQQFTLHFWVVRAINALLLHWLVRLGDLNAAIAGFATLGFPNCFGALDGTHIPIRAPEHSGGRYLNRKGYHSVVLQALVDSRGRFLDIYVGWPGSTHDARVFWNSGLCRRLEAGTYIPQQEIPVGDTTMPLCIIADAAYPLRPWLMHPYTGHLSASQERFNMHLKHACQVVERTLGRLKGCWRCLLTRLDVGPTNIPQIVGACSALHNLVESKGEAFFQGWAVEAGRTDVQPPAAPSRQVDPQGTRVQEALRAHFNEAAG